MQNIMQNLRDMRDSNDCRDDCEHANCNYNKFDVVLDKIEAYLALSTAIATPEGYQEYQNTGNEDFLTVNLNQTKVGDTLYLLTEGVELLVKVIK